MAKKRDFPYATCTPPFLRAPKRDEATMNETDRYYGDNSSTRKNRANVLMHDIPW